MVLIYIIIDGTYLYTHGTYSLYKKPNDFTYSSLNNLPQIIKQVSSYQILSQKIWKIVQNFSKHSSEKMH